MHARGLEAGRRIRELAPAVEPIKVSRAGLDSVENRRVITVLGAPQFREPFSSANKMNFNLACSRRPHRKGTSPTTKVV